MDRRAVLVATIVGWQKGPRERREALWQLADLRRRLAGCLDRPGVCDAQGATARAATVGQGDG